MHPNADLLTGFCRAFAAKEGAAMALGPSGKLLGWTPFVQNVVRKEARAGLAKSMAQIGG